MDPIYITGHKVPDLDSVIGAIAYAHLKSELDPKGEYIPAITGDLNVETRYVLEKYQIAGPQHIDSIAGKKVILVDHNEREQVIDGLDEAELLEVIDHHKMNFSYSSPIRIIIEPIGSSCSVIAKMFKADDIAIPSSLAAAMLGAVLVDTVITKSPTTTDEDMKIIEELATTAGIESWKDYGMELFKIRSSVSDLKDSEVITADFKDFDINGKKFGIGQVETVDVAEFDDRREGLLQALAEKRSAENYDSLMLFITDILKEESHFLVSSEDEDAIAGAFGETAQNGQFTAKVLSRKKQVVPTLLENIS